jgi:hypothetical protein
VNLLDALDFVPVLSWYLRHKDLLFKVQASLSYNLHVSKHCILAVAFTNQRTMPPVHTFYISNKISFLFSDLYLADSHIYLFFSCPLFLILTDIVTVKVMIKLTLLDAVTSLRGSP